MKPVHFLGRAREALAAFPENVRRRAGHELFLVQIGRTPTDFKAMPTIGTGVHEIRIRDEASAFRIVYVAKTQDAVYVLHAFQKKSRRTSLLDIELATLRYRSIGVRK